MNDPNVTDPEITDPEITDIEANNSNTVKILVVDDDRQLQENLCTFLEANGFETLSLLTGREVAETIARENPGAVLLDVMLPGGRDGFDILRQIRHRFDLPVLMLTARGKEIDTVVGLEAGADDYLSKPFRNLELLARIRAVLRRTGRDRTSRDRTEQERTGQDRNGHAEASSSAIPDLAARDAGSIRAGGFSLNTRTHTLSWQDRSAELSATEVRVLQALMENPGDVLEREVLLTLVFGKDYHTTNRNVDVHVSHIRGHIRQIAPERSPIRTVWGSGYRWMDNG